MKKLSKLLAIITKLFYTSWIGNLYFSYLLWLDRRKFKADMKLTYSKPGVRKELSASKIAYDEGISKVKTKLAELAGSGSKEDYEATLSGLQELLSLASNEQREEIEALKKVYLYKGKDIKNDTQKAQMIEKRIQDFMELRKHKENREKLRQERRNKNGS